MISSPTIPTAFPPLRNERAGAFPLIVHLTWGLITADKLPEVVGVLRTRSAAVAFAGASSPQALPLRFRFTFQFSSQRASLIRDAPSILFSFQQRHDPPRMPRCTRVAGPSTTRELCASQARFFPFLFPGCRGFRHPTATYITVRKDWKPLNPGAQKRGNNCRESALADPRTRIRM